ncbi:uncharacterized protein DDB_G0283357-like [Battus philenor]|uniref:uncharacterized protein DDB_G0283357-like n=1 Tax=Battus philenor TaxID=42288 RepID=UPI0035CED49F
MRRLLVIAVVSALAVAKPELYKETEDFQYSRSSTDEGSKAGFYGAQRGNMGGNYEKAHNMDRLAQHQMSGLVRTVDGELGDGYKTRTGSVYSAANSRGIYGSGNYDLSNLQGRNFDETESFSDSLSHSSRTSQNSGFQSQAHAHSGAYSSSNRAHSSGFRGYTAGEQSQQFAQTDNLQSADNLQTVHGYDYENQAAQYLSSGHQSHHGYEQSNANIDYSGAYGENSRVQSLSSTPVRIVVRPGARLAIPLNAQTYDTSRTSSFDLNRNNINRQTEAVSNSGQTNYKPELGPKHYEASYSYRKEWEKHNTQPISIPVAIPTSNPFAAQSDNYNENQAANIENIQKNSNFNSYNSGASDVYTGNTKAATTSRSRYQAGFNARHGSSTMLTQNTNGFNTDRYNAQLAANTNGFNVDTSNSRLANGYSTSSGMSSLASNANEYNAGRSSSSLVSSSNRYNTGSSSLLTSSANGYNGAQTSAAETTGSADSSNLVELLSTKPKSYHSSYSYHKAWERQGDPYVIKPVGNGALDSQIAQKLTAASSTQGAYASHHYGSQYKQAQQSFSHNELGADCDEEGHIRVARSYDPYRDYYQNLYQGQEEYTQQLQSQSENLKELSQQQQSHWDYLRDLGQQEQNQWDNFQTVGQETQNQMDNIQNIGLHTAADELLDLGQQTQNNWDNNQDLPQQPQEKFEKLEDLGQQPQNQWDSTQDLSQQPQEKFDKLEDLGQQTQNQWDNTQDLSQQPQEKFDKLEDLGQQTQNQWDNTQDLSQQPQEKFDKLEDLGQQTQNQWDNTQDLSQQPQEKFDKLEDLGQQTQNQWDNTQDLSQQPQEKFDKLEDLGQQTQNQWDNTQDLSQQPQEKFDKLEDLGQQTQNQWDNTQELSQQPQEKFDKLEVLGQQTQNQWDNTQDLSQQPQEKFDKLEVLGQQTQNQWDNTQELSQQPQEKFDKLEDLGQQTQNQWDRTQDLSQQTQEKFDKLENLGQQTQNKWDTFENQRQQPDQHSTQQQSQNVWNKLENTDQQTQIRELEQQIPQEAITKPNKEQFSNLDQQSQSHWNVYSLNNNQYSQSVTKNNANNQGDFMHNLMHNFFNSESFHSQQSQNTWSTMNGVNVNENVESPSTTKYGHGNFGYSNSYWQDHHYNNNYNENYHHHYSQEAEIQTQTEQESSPLGSLWDKLDNIAKQTLNDKDEEDATQNTGVNNLNNLQNVQKQFDFSTSSTEKSNPTTKPNNHMNVPPADIGRGDIGPEDTSIEDTNSTPEISLNTVNKRNKTQKEIETLSLTRNLNEQSDQKILQNNRENLNKYQHKYNSNNEWSNVDNTNTFSVLSVEEQKPLKQQDNEQAIMPVTELKSNAYEPQSRSNSLTTPFMHTNSMGQNNINTQLNEGNMYEKSASDKQNEMGQQYEDFGQETQELQSQSTLEEFGQQLNSDWHPENDLNQAPEEIADLSQFKHYPNKEHNNRQKLESIVSTEPNNNEKHTTQTNTEVLTPAETGSTEPGFWKSVGSKLTNAKKKVFSWFGSS